jgi:hypothetical protein
MGETGSEGLTRAEQTVTMKCDSGGLLSSLRTCKPGLIKTLGETCVSLLMNFMRNFLNISRSPIQGIITEHLHYRKPRMLMRSTRGSVWVLLYVSESYRKECDDLPDQIL